MPEVRSRAVDSLTPRQREVIQLVVAGKTNAEIAETLGVSLDGAKWHLREIFARLGVDTREEAAELWRAHHGLPRRLRRIGRSLAALPHARWLFGRAIAAAVAGLTVALVLLALNGGGPAPAVPVPTSTATPSPSATPSQPQTPALTATPFGDPTRAPADIPAVVAGVPVRPLTVLPSVPIPDQGAVYVETGCWQCDGGVGDLDRVYHLGGKLVRDRFVDPPHADAQILRREFSADGYTVTEAVCEVGVCWGLDGPVAGSLVLLYRSRDGGQTWEPTGNYTLGSHWTDIRLTADPAESAPPGTDPDWGLTIGSVRAWSTASQVRWLRADGSVLVDAGIALGQFDQFSPSALAAPDIVIAWWTILPPSDSDRAPGYLLLVYQSNRLVRAWDITDVQPSPGNQQPGLAMQLGVSGGGEAALGIATSTTRDSSNRQIPVVGDYLAGTITPLEGEYFRDTPSTPRQAPVAYLPGPLARVDNLPAGDCLNLRQSPATTAPSLACVAPGVLLRITGDPVTDGGRTWLPILTTTGAPAFAATEFLTH